MANIPLSGSGAKFRSANTAWHQNAILGRDPGDENINFSVRTTKRLTMQIITAMDYELLKTYHENGVIVQPYISTPMMDWCDQHITGYYFVDEDQYIYFENSEDRSAFIIAWNSQ